MIQHTAPNLDLDYYYPHYNIGYHYYCEERESKLLHVNCEVLAFDIGYIGRIRSINIVHICKASVLNTHNKE